MAGRTPAGPGPARRPPPEAHRPRGQGLAGHVWRRGRLGRGATAGGDEPGQRPGRGGGNLRPPRNGAGARPGGPGRPAPLTQTDTLSWRRRQQSWRPYWWWTTPPWTGAW